MVFWFHRNSSLLNTVKFSKGFLVHYEFHFTDWGASGDPKGQGLMALEEWWKDLNLSVPTTSLCLSSTANHSDSESFPVVQALFSQDGCQREGFWEVVGHVVSPFDLSWTLPVGGSLLVLCSLPGPPVVKQLMQMVTMVPGQGGRFQSVCLP